MERIEGLLDIACTMAVSSRGGRLVRTGRTREDMATVYPSKIDAWLVAVLAIAAAMSVFAALTVLAVPSPMAWAVAALTVTVGAGLPLWLSGLTVRSSRCRFAARPDTDA